MLDRTDPTTRGRHAAAPVVDAVADDVVPAPPLIRSAGWFPDPDGLSITGKEGSRIQFFSRQRDGLYLTTLKSGLVITLERAAQ